MLLTRTFCFLLWVASTESRTPIQNAVDRLAHLNRSLDAPAPGGIKWNPKCHVLTKLPSSEEFVRMFVKQRMPVIFRGLSEHFGGLEKKWTLDYMKENFGETEHTMSYFDKTIRNGAVRSNEPDVNNTLRTPFKDRGTLEQAIAIMENGTDRVIVEQSPLYMADGPGDGGAEEDDHDPNMQPEMFADLKLPTFASNLYDPQMVNLWFGNTLATAENGGKPKSSPLHHDGTDNFLYQIAGQKKLIVYR
jgi:hypothetical protein